MSDYSKFEPNRYLSAVSGKEILETDFPEQEFCVEGILPQGLALIGGPAKVGKSWLMLDWAVRISKGEKIWGSIYTKKGSVLYISLEDTMARINKRLSAITDSASDVYFSTCCQKIGDGLEDQIEGFIENHPDTVLIIIDILQMIRKAGPDLSYAGDYSEISSLKKLSDKLKVTILLVHHCRKQTDNDPFKMLSGTTGLTGAADTMFVLNKSRRASDYATLYCTGRDIQDREIDLFFNRVTLTWNLVSDSMCNPEMLLPDTLQNLIQFMEKIKSFEGGNSDFVSALNDFAGSDLKPNVFKKQLNKWHAELEKSGVFFSDDRKDNQRILKIFYKNNNDKND